MNLDTRGEMFPASKDVKFTITEVPELQDDGRSWKFKFKAIIDGADKSYIERFWPEGMKALAMATGGKESVPGVFEWEPTECLNQTVLADIEHQEQKKGKNQGKTFPRMVNIRPSDIPF